MAHLSELKQDPANVNAHAERGAALTRRSIERFGARLAGVVDRNGVIIDGNDRQIAYGEVEIDEIEIIEADPNKPIYLKFNDLDLADPTNPARELQVALHRSAALSWVPDAEALLAHLQSGVPVDDWFRQDEIDKLVNELESGLYADQMMGALGSITEDAEGADDDDDDDDDGLQSPYVQLSFPCNLDERAAVMAAIHRAKADFGVATSTQALVRLCNHFMGR